MKKLILLLMLTVSMSEAGFSQSAIDVKQLPKLTHDEFAALGRKDLQRVNKRPYTVQYKHPSGGELLYFGSSHVYDPKHPMLKSIDSLWRAFKPEVVFWEGGNPDRISTLPDNFDETIQTKGEPGLVRFRARELKIPDYTLEPSSKMILKELQKSFTDEEIMVRNILGQVEQASKKQTNMPIDSMVTKMLKQAAAFNLQNVPANLAEFEAAVKKLLPGLPDWRKIDLDVLAPKSLNDPGINTMQKIATLSNEIRDYHMLELLLAEVQKGKKVFAVVGASHVIIQEPALCKFFGVKYH